MRGWYGLYWNSVTWGFGHLRTAGIALLVAAAMPSGSFGQTGARARVPELILTELKSVEVPSSFSIRGGVLIDRGRVVLFAISSPAIAIVTEHQFDLVDLPPWVRPIGVGSDADHPSFVQIVDGPSGSVLGVDLSNGRIFSREPLFDPSHFEANSGTLIGKDWFVVGIDGRRVGGVCRFGYDRTPDCRWEFVGTRSPYGFVTGDEGEVLIAPVGAGEPALRLVGDSVTAFDVAQDALGAAGVGVFDIASWVSSPIVSIGRGYLRVLGEISGDQRVIVLYDSNGALVRARISEGPLGFFGSDVSSRVIVALRTTDLLEIAFYKWRWE